MCSTISAHAFHFSLSRGLDDLAVNFRVRGGKAAVEFRKGRRRIHPLDAL